MTVSALIRLVSILLTAIVVISFGLFVWDELGSASKSQTQLAAANGMQVANVRDTHGRLAVDENGKLRVNLDKANDALTSPGESIGKKFSGGNAWALRGAAFLFGMLVFLLGLRVLASWIEMSGPASGSLPTQGGRGGEFTAGSR
ncbi:MAG: hypothetical protein JHC95_17805 [Solirubrobacteraceae bacterium]|nr:hypothetical protein [Solirubrobacteraceae bacterium]